ncbi:hypothetical protein M0L39_RS16445 [Providencia rettgeri]|nr:hypothetical protein [Providencia rettgeri]
MLIKLSTIAIAMGMVGTAVAATAPADVGEVTLFGAFTQNNPNWVFSVYDYPRGENLNLNPTDADTTASSGNDVYDLSANVWARAAMAYLPMSVELPVAQSGVLQSGLHVPVEVALLTGGNVIVPTVDPTTGFATIELPATVDSGTGTLTLSADHARVVVYNTHNTTTGTDTLSISTAAAPLPLSEYIPGQSSCFLPNDILQMDSPLGTTGIPTINITGRQSAPVLSTMINDGLQSALADSPQPWTTMQASTWAGRYISSRCTTGLGIGTSTRETISYALIYGMALKPDSLVVPAGSQGAWSASITISMAQL